MTSPFPSLALALQERYVLIRELGRGGMATVYLALDRRHHREVAVKVLRPDLAASIGSERFLKEIEIAARLTHPHILALYDSGRAAGPGEGSGEFLYYVMPYVEGGSLRQRLLDQKRLAPAAALKIAEPVADALAYAHRMGIYHRDIKPENILFSQGHPIVGDFGIAKAISTAGGANLTRTGFPLGTPGYMSPEQAAGLTDLDARTDVYSLAVVIYEMLLGEIPGRWPTEDEVRSARFAALAPAHRAVLTEAGAQIEAALIRGLAVRHDQRTATPGTLISELTGVRPEPRRRYSGDEVQEIVRRASELEASRPTESGTLTIGGVEELGREVGIAPEVLREAARSVARTAPPTAPVTPGRSNPWAGGPTSLAFERVIDGEVPEAEFPTMVEEIRRVLNLPGTASQFGRSFSWSAGPTQGSTRRALEISVSVRGGRTTIAARENLNNLVGGVFGGILGGVGGGGLGPILGILGGGLHFPGAVIGALVPAWLISVYGGARKLYRYNTNKRTSELTTLMDRLEALALELADPRPALKRPVSS